MSTLAWLSAIAAAMAAVCYCGVFERSDGVGALVLVGFAVASAVCASYRAGMRGIQLARAPLGVLAALLTMACTAPALLELGTRVQRLDAVSPIIFVLVRALGAPVELVDGVLYAERNQLIAITSNWGKLGALPVAWILIATVALVLVHRRSGPVRLILRVLCVVVAFSVVRYALLVILALQHPEAGQATGALPFAIKIFIQPRWQALSFAPLALFLSRFAPWSASELALRSVGRRFALRAALASGMAVLTGAAWSIDANYETSGARKQGRVLVDELHSEGWSSAVAELDTEHYGRETVYNYTLLVRFLRQYFDVRVNVDQPYTDGVLSDVDVLVLKTATSSFAPGEVDAIESFVRRGGGLFVIGDHTDLLGMTTNLNMVAARFDMRFRPDACNQLQDGQTHEWRPLPWSVHPLTEGVRHLEFQTSCTLETPVDAAKVLVVRNAFSDPLDYSAPSFFGDVAPGLDDDIGVHVVSAARGFDRGRVVLFGDSTVFSSFGLTLPDRAQLLLRTIDWLNCESAPPGLLSRAASLLMWIALAALVATLLRLPSTAWFTAAPVGLLVGALLGASVARALNARDYPSPTATRPMTALAFVTDGCDFELPSPLHDKPVAAERAFDTFFTWTQRVGLLPVVEEFPEALERDAIVVIRPTAEFASARSSQIARYVRAGGALMVIGDDAPALDVLLSSFGVRASPDVAVPTLISLSSDTVQLPAPSSISNAVLFRVEKGAVLVVSAPQVFSRIGLGSQIEAVGPGDARIEVFEELYGLLRSLARRAS